MASLNKVTLIGNLGADPEVRHMTNGDQVANIRLATTDTWRDKASGEQREATEWHRVVVYRRLAEIAGQYLKKGSQIYLEGRIKTRKWQDKDGKDQYTTEIEATELKMLGKREGGDASAEPSGSTRQAASTNTYRDTKEGRTPPPSQGWDSDDVPF